MSFGSSFAAPLSSYPQGSKFRIYGLNLDDISGNVRGNTASLSIGKVSENETDGYDCESEMLSMRNRISSHPMCLPRLLQPVQLSQFSRGFSKNNGSQQMNIIGSVPLNQENSEPTSLYEYNWHF